MKAQFFSNVYGRYPSHIQKINKSIPLNSWVRVKKTAHEEIFEFTFKRKVKMRVFDPIEDEIRLEYPNFNHQHQIVNDFEDGWGTDSSWSRYLTLKLHLIHTESKYRTKQATLSLYHCDDTNFGFRIPLDKVKDVKDYIFANGKNLNQTHLDAYMISIGCEYF